MFFRRVVVQNVVPYFTLPSEPPKLAKRPPIKPLRTDVVLDVGPGLPA
jgi:hypothetical protein